MKTKSINKKYIKVFQAILLLGPLILLLLPATYFDYGKSICLSIRFFGIPCIGCGITRAIMHLIHFDFKDAWELNKISFLVTPVGILFWFHLIGKIINKPILTIFNKLY